MQISYNLQIQQSVPPQIKSLVPFIHALHALLHHSYVTAPNNVNGYLKDTHQLFWYGLDKMQQWINGMNDIELYNLE